MVYKTILILLTLFSVFFSQGTVWAIQALTDTEMDDVTGQAGVSIFVTTTMVTHNRSTFIVYDTKGGTIEFTPFNTTLVAATRNKTLDLDILNYNDDTFGASTTFTDTWLGGGSETRTIQHALNDHVYINASIENMYLNINSTIDNVLFNGVSLGPMMLTNMQIAGADLNVFRYDGMGIDATFKTRFSIEKFAYIFDNEQAIDRKHELQIKNMAVAGSFGGAPLPSYKDTVNPGDLINTAAWTPQEYFEFGDMRPAWSFTFVDSSAHDPFPTATVNSISIDFKDDTSPFIRRQYIIDWQGNYNPDPDGLMGDSDTTHVSNPRANSVYAEVGLPTKGSIRVADVGTREFTGGLPTEVSFGPVAIDGIRGYSRIEVPGYGIGNSPTTSTLYDRD